MTYYKILDTVSGKFSTGGVNPSWTKMGKSWGNIGYIKSHLNVRSDYNESYGDNVDIVKYELVEVERESMSNFQDKQHAIIKQRKLDEAERFHLYKEANQKRKDQSELDRLKLKYPEQFK